MNDYKRIAKNTIFLYCRMLVIMALNFYTVRVVLNTLGVTDFGIYNLVGSFVIILSFLNSTLASGTQRFLTFAIGKNDKDSLSQTFSISLMIHILLALIILLLAETLGLWFLYHKMNIPPDKLSAAFWVFQFSVLTAMVTITQVPYNAMIIAQERMNVFAYISIAEAALKLISVYCLIIVSYDKLISYSALMFAVSVLVALIYRSYTIKNYNEAKFRFCPNISMAREILHFSGWNIFGTLGALLSNQGINIILNIFFGPAAVAAQSISMQVNNGLNQIVSGFQQAVTPQITKLYANERNDELKQLLYHNSKYAYLLLWLLALPVFSETEYILTLWLVNVPDYSVLFCHLIIIRSLLQCLNKPFIMVIHATGKMKEVNLSSGILVLMIIPVSYALLNFGLPIETPMIVYIVTVILCSLISIFYSIKWVGISLRDYNISALLPVLAVSFLSAVPAFIIKQFMQQSFLRFSLITGISFILTFVFSYYIALNKNERAKFRQTVSNKMLKIS